MSVADSTLVHCPACQAVLPVPTSQLGKKIRCGKCNEIFQSPAPAALVEDDNPFAIPSTASATEEDTPRPRPRSPEAKKGLGMPVIIGAAVLAVIVLGGAAFGIRYALKDKEPVKTAEGTNKQKEQPKPREKEKPKEKELVLGSDGKMADATLERVKGSTVYIRTIMDNGVGMGTGFFAAGPGLVVTNAHVIGQTEEKIEKVKEIQVVLNSGQNDERAFVSKLLKADRGLDLALLKVDIPNNAPPLLEVIDSFKLKETQTVYIFGFPGGERLGRTISVNMSTISSFRREQEVSWIQVAGGMHPGNSGGPVTDAYGRVVGVCRAIIRGTPINMAIPGDSVHNFFHNAGELIPKTEK